MSTRTRAHIPNNVKAYALGLLNEFGGIKYTPTQVMEMVNRKFHVPVKLQTVKNWRTYREQEMKRSGITEDFIKDVMAQALKHDDEDGVGSNKVQDSQQTPLKTDKVQSIELKTSSSQEISPEEQTNLPGADSGGSLLTFKSTAAVLSYLKDQGFIISSSVEELGKTLDQAGLMVIDKNSITMGAKEVLEIEPLELDFELMGRNMAGNPVIMFYWAVAKKFARLKGVDIEFNNWVTACIIDAMEARKFIMSLIVGGVGGR